MIRAFAFFLLTFALPGLAAGFDYRVELIGLGEREQTMRPHLDIEAWHKNEEMNLDQLQRLHAQTPERIKELLATEGHFNAEVIPSLRQDGETWVASYRVDPGPAARVDDVDVRFEGDIQAQTEVERRLQLLRGWPLPKGSVFTQNAWRAGKRALLEDLSSRSYPYAALKHSAAEVSDDGTRVSIGLTLDSGPKTRFGDIVIVGLTVYPESIVHNLNTTRPGQDFDRGELIDYQQRLIESGYFSGVIVEPRQRENDPRTADVLVQLTELKRQRLRLGMGYSTDTRLRGQIEYEHRNVEDKGWRWTSLIRAEGEAQTVSTVVTLPPSRRGYLDSLGYSYQHTEDQDNEAQDIYNNRFFGRRVWGDSRYERSFTLELLNEILYKKRQGQNVERSDTTTVNVGYNWLRREVDDLVFPTRGHILELQGLFGSQLELSPYLRLYSRWNRYLRLSGRWSFIGRTELGMLIQEPGKEADEIPATYRFLGGGDNSVRGYSHNSLGTVLSGQPVARSAKTLALASAEFQYWFTGKWGAAVFYDLGSVDEKLFGGDWYPGYGAGIRWRSPVGPLNLDYAYGRKAIDKEHYQLHFSIGVAF